MKTIILTFATIAAQLVAAQDRADYFPECSLDCLDQGTKDATNCSLDDAWCWCIQSNYEAIYNSATVCVINECGAIEAVNDVLPAAIPFCSAATSLHAASTKTTAQESTSAVKHTTSAAGETTSEAAEPTSAVETSAAETTEAAETTVAETSAAETSAVGTTAATTSGTASSSLVTSAATTAVVVFPSHSSNGTVPSATESVVLVPTGAAAQVGSIGTAAMLALGALAAF
ncbi:Fc.00g034700.m01.CDS01 [Cosmosporella sp. VM-42]